jgi:two-component system KDP operon response regulator KdpE
MLTARGQEADRVKGLEMGADDYVAKPFSLRELAARVEAVLRRSKGIQEQGDEVVYGDDYLVIDAGRMEVHCAGQPVNLTATERRVLFLLARNQGRLLTAGQILTSVWGPDYVEEVSYVRLYIWRLRQKIEPVPNQPRYILTEHGMGYRFIGTS